MKYLLNYKKLLNCWPVIIYSIITVISLLIIVVTPEKNLQNQDIYQSKLKYIIVNIVGLLIGFTILHILCKHKYFITSWIVLFLPCIISLLGISIIFKKEHFQSKQELTPTTTTTTTTTTINNNSCKRGQKHIGDGICNDGNNNQGCQYDGGDCCGISQNKDQYKYCKKCRCIDPNADNSVFGKYFGKYDAPIVPISSTTTIAPTTTTTTTTTTPPPLNNTIVNVYGNKQDKTTTAAPTTTQKPEKIAEVKSSMLSKSFQKWLKNDEETRWKNLPESAPTDNCPSSGYHLQKNKSCLQQNQDYKNPEGKALIFLGHGDNGNKQSTQGMETNKPVNWKNIAPKDYIKKCVYLAKNTDECGTGGEMNFHTGSCFCQKKQNSNPDCSKTQMVSESEDKHVVFTICGDPSSPPISSTFVGRSPLGFQIWGSESSN